MQFKEILFKLRNDNKLSQKDLAEKINVSLQEIASWEDGLVTPSTKDLVNLSYLFNVSLDVLLGKEEVDELKTPVSSFMLEVSKKEAKSLVTLSNKKANIVFSIISSIMFLFAIIGFVITFDFLFYACLIGFGFYVFLLLFGNIVSISNVNKLYKNIYTRRYDYSFYNDHFTIKDVTISNVNQVSIPYNNIEKIDILKEYLVLKYNNVKYFLPMTKINNLNILLEVLGVSIKQY